MAVWMDMTNSMHVWDRGVVGIVRAELEIAKNLKNENPDVRFFKYDGTNFLEIRDEDLSWLWDCESVGDAYLRAMGRSQTAGTRQDTENASVMALRRRYGGLDNAYRYSTSRLYRIEGGLLLYIKTLPPVVRTVVRGIISLAFRPLKALSLWRAHRLERKAAKKQTGYRKLSHPFQCGDTIFSCGWMYSGKEEGFEEVKESIPNIFLAYLVYDIILVRENTQHYYMEKKDFENYLQWISFHCNAVLCGGCTTMTDLQSYQKEHVLPCLDGYPIYFGSDIIRNSTLSAEEGEEYARKAGIAKEFIMAVGSIDSRKNYSTLYRAITILAEKDPDNCPQLVIVGKGDASLYLLDTMQRDPLTEERILLVSPSDAELDWLYRNAAFVVLASAWEGWSLTLPEAMNYHKLVLVSDVAPLREAGQDYVVYMDPFDPLVWANQIDYYCRHPEAVTPVEKKLEGGYHRITWEDCGKQVNACLQKFDARSIRQRPSIYMDITLTWTVALYGGSITGILRTELMLARNLYRQYRDLKFFSLHDVLGYMPIDVSIMAPVITGDNLDADFSVCCQKIQQMYASRVHQALSNDRGEELENKRNAFWLLISVVPAKWQNKLIAYGKRRKGKIKAKLEEKVSVQRSGTKIYKVPFQEGDLVFTAGTGSGKDTYDRLLQTKEEKKFLYCPIIYDFTPMLMPQVHQDGTVEHYTPFIEYTSKMADLILYGGETARRDGIAYQKKMGLPQPPSCAIRFGSDIGEKKVDDEEKTDEVDEAKVLKKLGIKGPFIMAVGTIEIRKNHETLYRAYLRMLEGYEDIPQMVFAGRPGWKTDDFLAALSRDGRVKGKILQISPTDKELDILYRHCEFTLLASMYEGWSLTLPESYWYGKFCLCCDTPALKETGGDLAEYIHRWDEKQWSERIMYYHTHPEELEKREQAISKQWHSISWEECAENILQILNDELEAQKDIRQR